MRSNSARLGCATAGASVARLQGDAADSPIVEDARYFMFDAALLYRFAAK